MAIAGTFLGMLQSAPRPEPDSESDPAPMAEVDWRIVRLRELCAQTDALIGKAKMLEAQMAELRTAIDGNQKKRAQGQK